MTLTQILEELEKHYNRSGLNADYPEDGVIAAIQSLANAVRHEQDFNWSEHAIAVREGAIESRSDQQEGR